MTEPFVPFKPEKMIRAMITAKEAHLLKSLRKFSFGKVIVHKANGVLVRVELGESILLNENDGLDLVEK